MMLMLMTFEWRQGHAIWTGIPVTVDVTLVENDDQTNDHREGYEIFWQVLLQLLYGGIHMEPTRPTQG